MAINNVTVTQGSNAQVFASGTVPAGKTYGVTNILICNTAAEDQTGANDATHVVLSQVPSIDAVPSAV